MTDLTAGASTAVQTGTLQVTARFTFVLFNIWLYVFQPKINIDGQGWKKLGWGESNLPVSAGQHQVDIEYKFYWLIPIAKASTTVNVPPGGTVALDYKAPLISWPGIAGTITHR